MSVPLGLWLKVEGHSFVTTFFRRVQLYMEWVLVTHHTTPP